MKKLTGLLVFLLFLLPALTRAQAQLDLVELPDGFSVTVYAEGVENARQMSLGDKGTLFVGSRKAGKVYALTDLDGDQHADRIQQVLSGLDMPSGLEFRDGALYVGERTRIQRYDGIEARLENPPDPVLLIDGLPGGHHKWKYLRFGPDGMLYFGVGAPCNICNEPGHMQLRRMQADGSGMEVFAEGVRNSLGLAFHPETGELWFTENGRDHMGDNLPEDELNHAPRAGMHFGYPFCHQGDTLDPEFGDNMNCSDYVPPAMMLGPHVAPLGMAFYTGDMFPDEYRKQLFIAEHGSWNRSEKIGYEVKLVRFDDRGQVTGQKVFAAGWLEGEESWGRPVDVFVMPDGALLVSDDKGGLIYRISYAADG